MIHHGAARAEAAARHPRCLTAPPSPEQYAPRRPEGVQTYILRRLLALAPTLFFASLIVFVTVRLIPGNVIDLMLSQNDISADKFSRDQLIAALGLDKPMWEQ